MGKRKARDPESITSHSGEQRYRLSGRTLFQLEHQGMVQSEYNLCSGWRSRQNPSISSCDTEQFLFFRCMRHASQIYSMSAEATEAEN